MTKRKSRTIDVTERGQKSYSAFPIFTMTDQGDEITSAEVGVWQSSNAIN